MSTWKKAFAVLALCALSVLTDCSADRVKPSAEDKRCGIAENECDLCSDIGQKFMIAVVGDGVKDETPAMAREYPVNRAQGEAMWNGVDLALKNSAFVAQVKDTVIVKGFDDGGSAECAKRIAECLYHNACVLAVIGHATSGTTIESANIYYKARIPLIMPIATSPSVFYPPGETKPRYDNLFRLPPSDDQFQAYAIGFIAIEKLKATKIYLIGDISPDASTYSKPIFEKLNQEILGGTKRVADEISREKASLIASNVKQANADLVIFAGYWSNFELLLGALEELYKNVQNKPKILLSDGCLSKDIDPKGFEIFVTFPSPDVKDPSLKTTLDLQQLTKLIDRQGYQSYEIYGYDALHILAQAMVDTRRAGISRASLIKSLNSGKEFQGAGFSYRFARGENITSNYYVFDVNHKRFETIPTEDLRRFMEQKRSNEQ